MVKEYIHTKEYYSFTKKNEASINVDKEKCSRSHIVYILYTIALHVLKKVCLYS